jgi:hypothetical protein
MNLLSKACLGLICVLILSACGSPTPLATPTLTEVPALAATQTPRPSPTPFPSRTPTLTAPEGTAEATPGVAQTAGAAPTQLAATNPPAAGGTAQDEYKYLGQSIPDRSQFLPNRVVTITWTVKNSGTNGWTKDYVLRYFSGPKPAKEAYNFTKDVPVNDTINFTVTFTTPADPGDYDIWFKLTNNAGQNFGDLDLVFTVSNSPASATSTPPN